MGFGGVGKSEKRRVVMKMQVSCTMTDLKKRKWAIRRSWLGWKRFVSLGFVVNFRAPNVSLFLPCWAVYAGRLLVEVVISDAVELWGKDKNSDDAD
jgi:hypothetical protein